MRIAIFDGESRSLRRTLDYQKCVLINDIATIVNIGHKELYFRHSNIYHDKIILILEYMYDYVMFLNVFYTYKVIIARRKCWIFLQ